jgi:hypothetical protein
MLGGKMIAKTIYTKTYHTISGFGHNREGAVLVINPNYDNMPINYFEEALELKLFLSGVFCNETLACLKNLLSEYERKQK